MRSRLVEEKKLDVSHILSHARIYVKPSKRGKSKSAVVTGGGEGDLDSDDSILGDTPKPIRTHHGSPSLSVQPIQKLSLHAPAPHGYQASRSSLPPSRMSSVSRSCLSSVAPGSPGLSVAPGSRGSSVFSTRTSYRASPPFPTQVSRTSPAIPALDASGSGSGIPSRASSIMPIHSSSNMTSRTSSAVPSRSHAPPPISRPGPSTGSSSTAYPSLPLLHLNIHKLCMRL
ncbi:hypothetical protein AGABI1DRAFT_133394 [Agaricus bisporus var. burnettii JB137-S8]|uniref:Uncharacterized protein n=1 Tax=Agaricus bisporus var. burnettii (strain JB137-S8 / ATCC MYA-4627 / FGSC 10392) TaxID=597362 RepID=K5WU88_AGABU|nr:uncharacterized protein AGABI1DRAFT_133394 [Agaricus bisporus var. burnettii JB137-S8]EKM74323.1 hypothetical protein AGABI1DRAFT_133394 [Agaricus bisporus var. burnettii JB137-S8]